MLLCSKSPTKDASNLTEQTRHKHYKVSRYQVKDVKHYTKIHLHQFPNVSAGKNFKIHVDRIIKEKYFTIILV